METEYIGEPLDSPSTLRRIELALQTDGLTVLRGFDADVEQVVALAKTLAPSLLSDHRVDRKPHPKAAGAYCVNPGNGEVGLHFELGPTPFRPDLVAFVCVDPGPATGGATLVCDGRKSLPRLSPEVRELLETRRIRYELAIPPPVWRGFGGLQGLDQPQAIEALQARFPRSDKVGFSVDDSGVLSLRYADAAITHRSTFSDGIPLLSAIVAHKYIGMTVTFADGAPIPVPVLKDIQRAMMAEQERIQWTKGDVLILDNYRVAHGREAFTGTKRRVYTVMANRRRPRSQHAAA